MFFKCKYYLNNLDILKIYITIFRINKENVLFFLVPPVDHVDLESQASLTDQLVPVDRVAQTDQAIPDMILFINDFGNCRESKKNS